MNTKIASFMLALVLATIACNGLPIAADQLPTPVPTETSTATATAPIPTSIPSATPEPKIPRIMLAPLWEVSNSPDLDKLFGNYPSTHLPTYAKALGVRFYLDLPDGWPEQPTELCIQWFRNGSQLKDWDGSVLCSSVGDCYQINSRHFKENGYEAGRYEVRLYNCKDEQLLEGPQAEVWLIDEEWVGDLRVVHCDTWTPKTCDNPAGQIGKFLDQTTVSAGTNAIYLGSAYANLPSGAEWQVEIYHQDQLIVSQTEVVTGQGLWSGWRITRLTNPIGAAFEPGQYTAKLSWKGQVIETISFEVKESSGLSASGDPAALNV